MMSNEKFEDLEKQEFAFLDTIDILSIIKENDLNSAEEIMHILEEDYEDKYIEQNPDDDFLFNYISHYDFVRYIKRRYGINFREETIYYFNL